MYLDARSFLVECGQFAELSARPIGDRLPGKAGCPETVFNCLVAILDGVRRIFPIDLIRKCLLMLHNGVHVFQQNRAGIHPHSSSRLSVPPNGSIEPWKLTAYEALRKIQADEMSVQEYAES
ncbi:hypothetical protein HZ326_27935 [Fusarium oxysporum f. sp. albedinis]|nr:hypothetical protein HZ326_27935 [Fusarium oxysporum f. sp. albedinis]